MNILVTGGAGYIGSHTCVELLETGHNVIVFDNLSNSSMVALERVKKITGKTITFYQADVRDRHALLKVFAKHKNIDAVIHFAGLKAVGESTEQPLNYYDNNIAGSINLFQVMEEVGVLKLVFSSSATVYGDPHTVPIQEDFPLSVTNPYGRSKLVIENVLQDTFQANAAWQTVLLRYFNPVGAHISGLIGEDPNGIPNNLMPYIAQVAVGKLPCLRVFGDDYPTVDGTGVRDYIHVVDLAKGHVCALESLEKSSQGQVLTVNLGTGKGYSVLEMREAFSQVSAQEIPFEIVARRIGDIAECYADASLAKRLLGWQAEKNQQDMCVDAWRWQSNNPQGYPKN